MPGPLLPPGHVPLEKLALLVASAIRDHNRAVRWTRLAAASSLTLVLPLSWIVVYTLVAVGMGAYGHASSPFVSIVTAGALLAFAALLWIVEEPATRYVGERGDLLLRHTSVDWTADIFGRPKAPLRAIADAVIYVPYLFGKLRKAAGARRVRASHREVLKAAELLPYLGDADGLVRHLMAGDGETARGLELLRSLGLARPRNLLEGSHWEPTGKLAQILADSSHLAIGTDPRTHAAGAPPGGRRAPSDPGARRLEIGEPCPAAELREGEPHARESRDRITVRSVWSFTASPADLVAEASRDDLSIAISEGGRLRKIDRTGRVVSTTALAGSARVVRITPAGLRMAALLASGDLVLVGEAGEAETISGESILGAISIELAEEGRLVVVGDIMGRMSVLDDRGALLHRRGQGQRIDFLAAAQGSDRIAGASRLGHVSVFSLGGEALLRLFLNREITKLEVDEAGGKCLLCVPSEGALIYDMSDGTLSTLSVDSPIVDASGDAFFRRLLIADAKGRLVLLDDEGRVLWDSQEMDAPRKVFLSDCGRRAWVVRSSGQVECLEIVSGEEAGARAIEIECAHSLGAASGPAGLATREPAWERVLPAPGGFRYLAVDPAGQGIALLSTAGSVLALDTNGNERWNAGLTDGGEDLVASSEGSWVALPCDRVLHVFRMADGALRHYPLPSRRIFPLCGTSDFLVLGESRLLRRISPESGSAWERSVDRWPWDAATCVGREGRIGVVLDGGVLLILDFRGATIGEASFTTHGKGAWIAATKDGFAVASQPAFLTLFDSEGKRLAVTRLTLPAQGVRSLDGLILATDRDGNRHLFGPALVPVGSRAPRPGISILVRDPSGGRTEAIGPEDVLEVNLWKGVLVCRTWDDRLLWQSRVPGSGLLVAPGAGGKNVFCLTLGRLFCFPLGVESLAAQRGQFLEI